MVLKYNKMRGVRPFIYFMGLFFLFFPPHVLIFGVVIKTVYFFIVVPAIMGIYVFVVKGERNIVVKKVLLFMTLGLVYLVLRAGIEYFRDISAIREMVMGFVIFFACYYFVYMYQLMYADQYLVRLFIDMNTVGVLHSVIIISTFLFPEFKLFLYDFIAVTGKSYKYLFNEVNVPRYQGIVQSGFSFLSTTHALLLIIGVWGFYMDKKNYRLSRIILFLFGQLILFTSIALVGRTGFVVLLMFLCIFVLWRIKLFLIHPFVLKKTAKLIFAFIGFLIVIFYSIDFSNYAVNLKHAFEFIFNWMETGRLFTFSTSVLLENEYFFPDNMFDLIFGISKFGRSINCPRIASDVGYVLFIYGAGIFGMLIAYSFYFVGVYYACKYRRLNQHLAIFIIVYFIMLIIVNFKDYYFVSYSGYIQVYFIMICALSRYVDYRKIFGVDHNTH